MLAGVGSGHHSKVKQIVTGYSTVNHAAEGHWETKVVGGIGNRFGEPGKLSIIR
ncbi:hypothetical protein [Adlercreutzia sp. ZJ141]|uniref:hypothetical protein n=1 Tax=Adlercreutzia sp. ZJ141 TaxID=2709406 RepID=UPI00197E8586|nr:hypothetical protein [Adlercreutzia sp. ZJ141]